MFRRSKRSCLTCKQTNISAICDNFFGIQVDKRYFTGNWNTNILPELSHPTNISVFMRRVLLITDSNWCCFAIRKMFPQTFYISLILIFKAFIINLTYQVIKSETWLGKNSISHLSFYFPSVFPLRPQNSIETRFLLESFYDF